MVTIAQLPAGLLASFPYSLSTFRKRVKKIVTSKVNSGGDWVCLSKVTWSEVVCVNKGSDVKNWCDLCEVALFWSEESYSVVLRDKSILYIRGTLMSVFECIMKVLFGVCLVLWLF
jgi:hypothetical protein